MGTDTTPRPDMNDPNYRDRLAEAKQKQIAEFQAYLARDKELFVKAIDTAAAKNPTIKRGAFKAYIAEIDNAFPRMSEEITQAYVDNDIKPDNTRLNGKIDEIRTRYGMSIRDKIYADFKGEGAAAMRAVAVERQPTSIFSGPIKAVYNSENGGVQWAGVVGGGLAGYLGYRMTKGMNTIVSVLGTVGLGAAGAYLANRFIDPKPKPVEVPSLRAEGPREGDNMSSYVPQEQDYKRMLEEASKRPSDAPDAKKLGIKGDDKLKGAAAAPARP